MARLLAYLGCMVFVTTNALIVNATDASGSMSVASPPAPDDPMSALMPTPSMRESMSRMRTMMMLTPVIDAVCEIDERSWANSHGDKPPTRPGECWMCLRACRMDSTCFSQCRKQINSEETDSSLRTTLLQPFLKNQECKDLNKCYNMSCSKQMIRAMNDADNASATAYVSSNNSTDPSSAMGPMQMHMAKMKALIQQQLKCVETVCASLIKPCEYSDGVQDACVVRGCMTSCRADCRAKCSAQCS